MPMLTVGALANELDIPSSGVEDMLLWLLHSTFEAKFDPEGRHHREQRHMHKVLHDPSWQPETANNTYYDPNQSRIAILVILYKAHQFENLTHLMQETMQNHESTRHWSEDQRTQVMSLFTRIIQVSLERTVLEVIQES